MVEREKEKHVVSVTGVKAPVSIAVDEERKILSLCAGHKEDEVSATSRTS